MRCPVVRPGSLCVRVRIRREHIWCEQYQTSFYATLLDAIRGHRGPTQPGECRAIFFVRSPPACHALVQLSRKDL